MPTQIGFLKQNTQFQFVAVMWMIYMIHAEVVQTRFIFPQNTKFAKCSHFKVHGIIHKGDSRHQVEITMRKQNLDSTPQRSIAWMACYYSTHIRIPTHECENLTCESGAIYTPIPWYYVRRTCAPETGKHARIFIIYEYIACELS